MQSAKTIMDIYRQERIEMKLPESWMMGNYHVRFGGGRLEKDQSCYLASRLPDSTRPALAWGWYDIGYMPAPYAQSMGMPLTADPTYQFTEKLIPTIWYENGWLTNGLYYALVAVLFLFFWPAYQLSPPLIWSIIGVLAYGLGWLADTLTTWRCFGLMPEFHNRGLKFPLIENSPLHGEDPRLIKQVFNASSIYSLAVLLLSWFAPALGIAGGLAHAGAALNNQRKRQRLVVQLELIDAKRGMKTT
jgi:hypothetical protein